MKVLGIDEAGRGAVIGPLVMCAYVIDIKNNTKLHKLGVKDSKLLSPKKREELFPKLQKIADHISVVSISAQEIDSLRTVSNLNKIELGHIHQLINTIKPDIAIVDSLEQEKRFKQKILDGLDPKMNVRLVAENFADKKYLEVGAASIIAKVNRDHDVKHLNAGSGYPADERTIKFLKDWIKVNKSWPPFVRSSWVTAQSMLKEKNQFKLKDFTD